MAAAAEQREHRSGILSFLPAHKDTRNATAFRVSFGLSAESASAGTFPAGAFETGSPACRRCGAGGCGSWSRGSGCHRSWGCRPGRARRLGNGDRDRNRDHGSGSRRGASRSGRTRDRRGAEAAYSGNELKHGNDPQRQRRDPHGIETQRMEIRQVQIGKILVVYLRRIFLVICDLHRFEGPNIVKIAVSVVSLKNVMRHDIPPLSLLYGIRVFIITYLFLFDQTYFSFCSACALH